MLKSHNPYIHNDIENELTIAFCVLANRIIPDYYFVPGDFSECNKDYLSLKHQQTKKIIGDKYFHLLFIDNLSEKSLLYNKFHLSKEIELLNQILTTNEKQDDYHIQYLKSFLNQYRYSLIIHEIIKDGVIDENEKLPILELQHLKISHIYKKHELHWIEPYALFNKDLYPLDLAFMAKNTEMLFWLIQKGVIKFTASQKSNPTIDVLKILSFLFDNAKAKEELYNIQLNFVDKFFYDIEKEIEIITETSDRGYSSRQKIKTDEGKEYIISWYRSALRLQNMEHLQTVTTLYMKQLFGILNYYNPYTATSLTQEIDIPYINMNSEINQYIKTKIEPCIKRFKFKSTSHIDMGIWGFDARTGRPIYKKNLEI